MKTVKLKKSSKIEITRDVKGSLGKVPGAFTRTYGQAMKDGDLDTSRGTMSVHVALAESDQGDYPGYAGLTWTGKGTLGVLISEPWDDINSWAEKTDAK